MKRRTHLIDVMARALSTRNSTNNRKYITFNDTLGTKTAELWARSEGVGVVRHTVQLLHKYSIQASDGPLKLLKVIKNPIVNHLPTGCTKLTTSFQAKEVIDIRDVVPEDKPIVFVVGGMAHGSVDVDYTENSVSISNYPLSAALTCAKLCTAFEEVWKVV